MTQIWKLFFHITMTINVFIVIVIALCLASYFKEKDKKKKSEKKRIIVYGIIYIIISIIFHGILNVLFIK